MPTELSRGEQSRLRILLITARADHGGGPRHILDLLGALRDSSIDFFIAAPNQDPYFAKFKARCKGTIEIPARSFSFSSFFELRRFAVENGIRIIHSHGRGAGLYSRLLAMTTPSIRAVHSFHGVHREPSVTGQIKMWIDRLLAFAPFYPLFVSEGERVEARKFRFTRARSASAVINNAVDLSRFSTRKPRAFGGTFRIGTLMRPDHAKGPDLFLDLVRACADHGKWTCVGITQDELSPYGSVDARLEILGRLADPVEWLQSLDVYVSTSRTEGLPLGVLEAMAAGCVCILSDISAHRLFSDAGAALLFDPARPATFASQIERLKTDVRLVAALRENSQALLMSRHSLETFRAQLESVYQRNSMQPICPMCGDTGANRRNKKFRFENETANETANVFQCGHCETAFLFPQPSNSWLAHEYSGYYNRRSSGVQKLEHFRRFFRGHNPRAYPKVLEVGGGEGACARALLESSPESDLTVIETHVDAAKFYRDIPCKLVSSTLESWLVDSIEKFDLIIMFDVLEHVRDPKSMLGALAGRLNPGGEIWLSVPNYDSVSRRLLGKIWPQYKPEHLFYFSSKGLASVCRDVGLDSVKIVRHRKYLPISYLFNVGAGFGPKLTQQIFTLLRKVTPEVVQRKAITFCLGERLLTARRETLEAIRQ